MICFSLHLFTRTRIFDIEMPLGYNTGFHESVIINISSFFLSYPTSTFYFVVVVLVVVDVPLGSRLWGLLNALRQCHCLVLYK